MHRRYGQYHTGARVHVPSASDYCMSRVPGVVAAAATMPDAYDLMGYEEATYQQGPIPCCVMASIALMKSLFDAINRDQWTMFDFLAAYHGVGGNDHEGVDTRSALQYAQQTGLQVVGSTLRHRIGSYALAPRDSPENFVNTLKAASWAKLPFVIACRLPSRFGWDYDEAPVKTPSYHQMLGGGYDRGTTPLGNVILGNSWGPQWGKRGWGRIPWEYLVADNFQGGDCYAWCCTDAIDPSASPSYVAGA